MKYPKQKNCWSCNAVNDYKSFFCKNCKKIQEPIDVNEYDLFDLEKKYIINLILLEKKYLDLQSLIHPDKFINTSEQEKNFSMIHSSQINGAYNSLINNISRANILLKILGYKDNSDDKSFDDHSILEEIMVLQNQCLLAEEFKKKSKIIAEIKLKISETLNDIDHSFKSKSLSVANRLNIKLSYLEKMNKSLK